jgi:hypothetical protein
VVHGHSDPGVTTALWHNKIGDIEVVELRIYWVDKPTEVVVFINAAEARRYLVGRTKHGIVSLRGANIGQRGIIVEDEKLCADYEFVTKD